MVANPKTTNYKPYVNFRHHQHRLAPFTSAVTLSVTIGYELIRFFQTFGANK
jgi:hypothetical protein